MTFVYGYIGLGSKGRKYQALGKSKVGQRECRNPFRQSTIVPLTLDLKENRSQTPSMLRYNHYYTGDWAGSIVVEKLRGTSWQL